MRAKTNRRLAEAVRWLRRGIDLVPVTPRALFVGGGAWLALEKLAYGEMDLVWLMVGYAALALLAASTLLTLLATLGLKVALVRRRREPLADRVFETARPRETGYSLSTLFFVPFVRIDWRWEQPAGVEVTMERAGLRLHERATFRDRGHFSGVLRRVVVEDVFGLARLALRDRDPVEGKVLPHVGRLGETPLLVSLSGGDERPHPMGVEDGDRVELRRYAPGDPARFIHWKVFARTKKLMVRVPERALAPARRTVAYFVAGPDDDATAAAAQVAVSRRALGDDWTFSADGAGADTEVAEVASEMILRSVEARERGASGLEPFLQRAERHGPASAVVFVPPRPGPWLARAVKAIHPRAARARFVVATDGVDRRPPRSWLSRLLARAPAAEGTPESDLERVLTTLGATRAEVILVDRRTGRRLSASHRKAAKRMRSQAQALKPTRRAGAAGGASANANGRDAA